MNYRKSLAIVLTGLVLLVLFFGLPRDSAAAPSLQMTPGVDPMSVPTQPAPTPLPNDGVSTYGTMSGSMNCPMMSGATGMTGMQGTGTMGTMPMQSMGMGTGMQSMPMQNTQSMPMQGMGMTGMSGMSMQGTGTVNDVLSNGAGQNWFFHLNPWWILGWVVLFLVVLGLLVAGVLLLVRLLRKDRPVAAG